MKRKLIKQGGGGLTFYVPKKWTESNELRAGDEIDITDVEDNLIISRGVKIKKKSSKIIVKKDSEQLIRIRLNALYRMGFDKITVLFKTKKQAKIVKEVIEKKFIGFEVVEEKGDLLVAENVTEPSGEKQKALLRRMFFIVDESFKLLEEDLKNGTTGNKENIIQMILKY